MSKLNQAQKQAVEYTGGPLLIVAGAGTGKTTVITEKIAYLIKNNLAKPEEILALTFTDKSAGEMLERVDKMVDTGYIEMQISTFHSFAERLLERHAIDVGLPVNFKLITATDAWLLTRKNLDKFNLDYYRPLGNPSGHIHELLKHFGKCKDELISPEEYLAHAENSRLDTDNVEFIGGKKSKIKDIKKLKNDKAISNIQYPISDVGRLVEIANAYHVYNQLLLDNNSLDFGDLIYYTIKLLEKRPHILNQLRERYKYILVDEFQDVNWAQYYLVKLLANGAKDGKPPVAPLGKGGGLTVVGDDDQSIYAFRGASVSNILRFQDDFPRAKKIVLTENYRSDKEILDLSYKLIQNNNPDRLEVKLKIDKKLRAVNSSKPIANSPAVEYKCLPALEDETKWVAEEIIRLKEKEDANWDEIAVLVRANSHADPFLNEFESRGIPYEFLASSGLYREPVVLDMVNFFESITDYHESASIYRLLLLPTVNLGHEDIIKLTHFAKKESIPLFSVLRQAGMAKVSAKGLSDIEKITALVEEGAKNSKDNRPSVVLYHFLDKSGYLGYLIKEENKGRPEIIRAIFHLKQFFDYILKFEALSPGARVREFLEHYHYVLESGDDGALKDIGDTPESVNILTVHKAKGLEFRFVFMVDLVEDRFPSRRRGDGIEIPEELIKEQLPEGDSHIEEERRLFYVGLTRAKEKLYLLSAKDYGGAREKKISRFVAELGFEEKKTSEAKPRTGTLSGPGAGEKVHKKTKTAIYPAPESFSYSQIKSYDTCPYQYKLGSVLKLPTGKNAVFSFGQTVHGALHQFYSRLQEMNVRKQETLFDKKDIRGEGIKVPSLEDLLKMYEDAWITEWYESAKQREDYFKQGKEILTAYYRLQEKNWTIPERLEAWFNIKIGGYSLRGRMDRVDKLPDGTLEIVDYKTGQAKDKVQGEDKDQLLIYQMAAERMPEFKALGKPQKLTYYYLNENTSISFLGDEKEIEKLENKIITVADKIMEGDFTATPGAHVCRFCDFKNICEFRV